MSAIAIPGWNERKEKLLTTIRRISNTASREERRRLNRIYEHIPMMNEEELEAQCCAFNIDASETMRIRNFDTYCSFDHVEKEKIAYRFFYFEDYERVLKHTIEHYRKEGTNSRKEQCEEILRYIQELDKKGFIIKSATIVDPVMRYYHKRYLEEKLMKEFQIGAEKHKIQLKKLQKELCEMHQRIGAQRESLKELSQKSKISLEYIPPFFDLQKENFYAFLPEPPEPEPMKELVEKPSPAETIAKTGFGILSGKEEFQNEILAKAIARLIMKHMPDNKDDFVTLSD